MHVRLTQLDGKMPNLALMRLAHYHRAQGDTVLYTRRSRRDLFEPVWDRVYGSVLFAFSQPKLQRFLREFPDAIVGGTGSGTFTTLEEHVPGIGNEVDYSDQDIRYSLGFLQRGCRLRCAFCVVPRKEGRPRYVQGVHDLWRGDPYPRHLHILDNDFFGVPEWPQHILDFRAGGFRVCLSQGINVRLISEEAAEALASIDYYDGRFTHRRIYTAWDNLGQEKVFFRGIDRLEAAGIPARRVMAYMLIGYAQNETLADIQYRFDRMAERGILPYPMIYDIHRKDLRAFQRWAVRGFYKQFPFSEYQKRFAGGMPGELI